MYMYDANDAGLVLTLSIPLTLLTLQTSRLQGRLLSLLFLYWEWTAIARTGSRGAFVGVLTVALGLLFLANGISITKRVGMLLVAALVLLVAAPQGYWNQMQSLTNPTDDYNWTERDGRKQIAQRGVRYMLEYPVTGLGINNFSRAEGTISDKAKNWSSGDAGVKWAAPHNSHIEAGAELGIPGLVLWVCMLIGGVVAPLRLRQRLPKSWRRGSGEERFIYAATMFVPISMLGFIVCCTFVSFAYLDPLYVLLAFVSGLYTCSDALLARPPRAQDTRARSRTNSALVVGMAVPRGATKW
jgi:O-antigen ligase